MSYTIWTSHAVASEAGSWSGSAWRLVESQHVASTMKLVDTVEEQLVLETLLESGKPRVPDAAAHLHYLLSTPFRYPPRSGGSRFRGETDPGVFYGADEVGTCCAEVGYWRLRFLRDAVDLIHIDPVPHSAFKVRLRASAIDLRSGSLQEHGTDWEHPDSYEATQFLGRSARSAGIGCILYKSVRDSKGGGCVAVLDPSAFVGNAPEPGMRPLWLSVNRNEAVWREG